MRRRTADFLQGKHFLSGRCLVHKADPPSAQSSKTGVRGEGEENGKWKDVQGADVDVPLCNLIAYENPRML